MADNDKFSINRRAVLQGVGAGTVGLPALAQVTAAQDQDYEPEVVIRHSFENGIVLAGPDRDLPPAAEIDYSPNEGGPKGDRGAKIAQAASEAAETDIAVRKRKWFRRGQGGNDPTTVESVVVTDRTPPEAAGAPEEQQVNRLERQGVFENLNEQVVDALDNQVEGVGKDTVFLTDRIPGRGWNRFPGRAQRKINDVVADRLETRFESTGRGFVAEPVSATTRPRNESEESLPSAYRGWGSGRRVDDESWCVSLCTYFCAWWFTSDLCGFACDLICEGVCWLIPWFADEFDLMDWEVALLREFADC